MSARIATLAAETILKGIRLDGWVNTLTGLGNALRDKAMATRFSASRPLSDAELDNLYHENDLASRVCDVVPEEMLRPGFVLTVPEGNTADAVMERWQELEGH